MSRIYGVYLVFDVQQMKTTFKEALKWKLLLYFYSLFDQSVVGKIGRGRTRRGGDQLACCQKQHAAWQSNIGGK